LPVDFLLLLPEADEVVFDPVLEDVFDLPAVPEVVLRWDEVEALGEAELPFFELPVVLPFANPDDVEDEPEDCEDLPDDESLPDPFFEIPVVVSEVFVGVWLAIILSY
jgi:hypothetical protein